MRNVRSSRISSSGPCPAPATSEGRVFSDLYASFVRFYLPGYSGCSVSLTPPPHLSLSLSQDSGSSFILHPGLSCQRYFPFSPSSALCTESCSKHVVSRLVWFFGFTVHCQCFLVLQLYGEYREQLGNFARREAARLLTERQWRRQAGDNAAASGRKGHGRRPHHHHHHHPVALESHQSHASSTKKPRPYSKCQGDQQRVKHSFNNRLSLKRSSYSFHGHVAVAAGNQVTEVEIHFTQSSLLYVQVHPFTGRQTFSSWFQILLNL